MSSPVPPTEAAYPPGSGTDQSLTSLRLGAPVSSVPQQRRPAPVSAVPAYPSSGAFPGGGGSPALGAFPPDGGRPGHGYRHVPGAGPHAPAAFAPPPGTPWFPPPTLHPYRRDPARSRLFPVLVALVLALLFGNVTAGTAAALVLGAPVTAGRAIVDTPSASAQPEVGAPDVNRDNAITALLDRRAGAVRSRSQATFIADVDRTDPAFLKRQETAYDNLTKLPLADLSFKLNPAVGYDAQIPDTLRGRFRSGIRAAAVTVSHQIEGVDVTPVGVPWVPIFASVGGRWMLVGEATDRSLPSGVGGQAWDADAITVARSDRVVGVFTAGSKDSPQELLKLADQALDRVAKVRPGGWAGKILLVAVRDRSVFNAYFGDAPERVDQVAAIAVPHYNVVTDWDRHASYSATRIIFNPDELSEDSGQLGDDLTHEFTHAAMGPVTSGWTPTWLVEGFAEYVSYKNAQISASALKRALKGVATDDLLTGSKFYAEPMNYITGWLACRMIAEKYGEKKLIDLYEVFRTVGTEDAAVDQVLGVGRAQLVKQWQDYVAKQRT